MSNDEINNYKRLYSEYVSHLVNLHNYHHQFTKTASAKAGAAVRRYIKFIIGVERELQRTTWKVERERKQNDIEAHRLAKTQAKLSVEEEKKRHIEERTRRRELAVAAEYQRKHFPKPSGRPKGKKK